MRFYQLLAAAASAISIAEAWNAPVYTGYTRVFHSNFVGPKGNQPNQQYWTYITGDKNDNNEFQRFTTSTTNMQLTGSDTLQIVPRRNSNAPKGWTSARIESKFTITPAATKVTRVEAAVRVGANSASHKQGIWPAVWMMGNSYRSGTEWPQSGEIDIFENINGEFKVYGAVHCGTYPNGPCAEPTGIVKTSPLTDPKFHVYRVEFDRTNTNWRKQTISWYKDGVLFNSVTGATINDADVWASICHKPLYFIINVSVGGNWVCITP